MTGRTDFANGKDDMLFYKKLIMFNTANIIKALACNGKVCTGFK